jgi:hypothetical protein
MCHVPEDPATGNAYFYNTTTNVVMRHPPLSLDVCHGDTESVRTLLGRARGQSTINYQDPNGSTPLILVTANGHASINEQVIEAHCKVDLQSKDDCSSLFIETQDIATTEKGAALQRRAKLYITRIRTSRTKLRVHVSQTIQIRPGRGGGRALVTWTRRRKRARR